MVMAAKRSIYQSDNIAAGRKPWIRKTLRQSLYDNDNVVADLQSGAISKLYVTPFLDQNLSYTNVATGASLYYSQDGLGSVRMMTDAGGAVVNAYDYDAFGSPYAPNTVEAVSQRYGYTGREKSAVGGPMYYRYRTYSSSVGRFGRRDPAFSSFLNPPPLVEGPG